MRKDSARQRVAASQALVKARAVARRKPQTGAQKAAERLNLTHGHPRATSKLKAAEAKYAAKGKAAWHRGEEVYEKKGEAAYRRGEEVYEERGRLALAAYAARLEAQDATKTAKKGKLRPQLTQEGNLRPDYEPEMVKGYVKVLVPRSKGW